MIRSGLVRRLSAKRKIGVTEADLIVAVIFGTMASALDRNESVGIRGLGTFSVRRYRGYAGRPMSFARSYRDGWHSNSANTLVCRNNADRRPNAPEGAARIGLGEGRASPAHPALQQSGTRFTRGDARDFLLQGR